MPFFPPVSLPISLAKGQAAKKKVPDVRCAKECKIAQSLARNSVGLSHNILLKCFALNKI